MYYDDGTTYKVRLFDDNGNPAKAGEKVTFVVGNKKYVKKTDKKGYASLKLHQRQMHMLLKPNIKSVPNNSNFDKKIILI